MGREGRPYKYSLTSVSSRISFWVGVLVRDVGPWGLGPLPGRSGRGGRGVYRSTEMPCRDQSDPSVLGRVRRDSRTGSPPCTPSTRTGRGEGGWW